LGELTFSFNFEIQPKKKENEILSFVKYIKNNFLIRYFFLKKKLNFEV